MGRRRARKPQDGPQTLFGQGAGGAGGRPVSAREALERGREVEIDLATIERAARKHARILWVGAAWWYAITFGLLIGAGRIFPKELGGPVWFAVTFCLAIWVISERRASWRVISEATAVREFRQAEREWRQAAGDCNEGDNPWGDDELDFSADEPSKVARDFTSQLFVVALLGYFSYSLVCLFFKAVIGMGDDGTLPGSVYGLATAFGIAVVWLSWPRARSREDDAPWAQR